MKIIDIKVMRGPNIWSTYRQKVIVMKLDLQGSEHFPTNKIDGFAERIEALLPSLYDHECSEDKPGGFFERVREGTWLGHVVEHVALELQTLAGMDCGYGRTRSARIHGVYYVVFTYEIEKAGIYAAKAAVQLVTALRDGNSYDINKDIEELVRIREAEGLNKFAQSVIEKARKKSIPYKIEANDIIRLGQGVYQHKIDEHSLADYTSVSSLIDIVYPGTANGRIPIVAVTGTNGKTTVTRLVAHLAKTAGHAVGYCTTDGVYINNEPIENGDCTGPASADKVLLDPRIDFAVLECARGGILRSGLGFDKCDISIITNITSDHLGLGDIETLEELQKVKAVVAHSTFNDGYTILNAEDDLVYAIRKKVDCRIALFGLKWSDRLERHTQMGGMAAYIDDGYFTISRHGYRTRIARVNDVPLTLNGRASCMIQNILPCLLVASIRQFSPDNIRTALQTFIPGPDMTPGRMNLFRFGDVEVMLDYVHNEDGMKHLAQFMEKTDCGRKIGIITSPGDRRNEDIRKMGHDSAKIFDELIIRHDREGRGRSNEDITRLLKEGIRQSGIAVHTTIVSDEIEAIKYALANAQPGDFIVVCSEKVQESIAFLSSLEKQQSFLAATAEKIQL
jgi:UDP-N-acetylmuramyl tripeptide synthase